MRIGINGFGRIGRGILRAARGRSALEIVAVNDLADARTLAHLLRHDSVHGAYPGEVRGEGDWIRIDGRDIRVSTEADPARVRWGELGVELVLECTGRFTRRSDCARHLDAGAKRVVVSAPAPEADLTVAVGINDGAFDPARHRVISAASCTTHCIALVAKVLHERFVIESGFVTTVHSYTNDQRLLDLPHEDLRRARAAALSMVPTTTGAARSVGIVLPELAGRLDGVSVRVPTPNVSLADFTAALARPATASAVNDALREAAEGPFAGLLGYCEEPLVSSDFCGDPRSAVIDAPSTSALGALVKVLAWYDNETGFSTRMVELCERIARAR